MRPSWFLFALALGLGCCRGARASDSDWLTTVFPERAYDFGNVARGSQIRHSFPVINRTTSEIRIADWRTKCGCTNVRVGARVIPPGTQTTVEATIDTTKFQGYKASGLTLVVDRPVFTEIDLNLSCFIRGDIMLNPGQLDFGTVRLSSNLPSAALNVTYAGGRPNWDIAELKTQTAKVKAVARELSRSGDGQIHWLITATLQPGVTTGYFKDEITLITNDADRQAIPISVVANLQSARVGHPVDPQLRPGPRRPGRQQGRAGSLVRPVYHHRGRRRPVRDPGRRAKQSRRSRSHRERHPPGAGRRRPVPRDPQNRERPQGRAPCTNQDLRHHHPLIATKAHPATNHSSWFYGKADALRRRPGTERPVQLPPPPTRRPTRSCIDDLGKLEYRSPASALSHTSG